MYILGLSAFYHDSAACLIREGKIIAAAQEERFTRTKHDSAFPQHAIQYCLREANILGADIEAVVFYEKPFVKFERLLETYLAFAPRGFVSFSKAMPLWLKDKLFLKSVIVKNLNDLFGGQQNWSGELLFSEHHLSHAASAFYPSPFESAAVLTLDGVGEWSTSSLALGHQNDLKVIKEIHFPHSLGLLYSAFTYYTGFRVNSGEYKVMGLAPYGTPRFADQIMEKLISVADDGSFRLDMSYFDYAAGLAMTNAKFHSLFGGGPREPETDVTQRDMDLAASVQKVTEEVVIRLAKSIAKETGQKNLCLAGGVALNCVANGILARAEIFDNLWIQPAAGDAGGALGAALSAWHLHYQKERVVSPARDAMCGSYLGPEFTDEEVEVALSVHDAVFKKLSDDKLLEKVCDALVEGKAVGWMQGRMEFGPRALGGRSILADPRSPKMQKQLNLKVKNRESFRPFAPSVLKEEAGDWFEDNLDSPYMLLVSSIKHSKRLSLSGSEKNLFGIAKLEVPRSVIPAVTHVDCSARVQTVSSDTNPRYHALISKFNEITGCPVLVNTSFNVRGEPIVCSPTDAFKCFMNTELDLLVIGNYLLTKADQKPSPSFDSIKSYALD